MGSILKYDTLTLYIKKYHYLIGQDGNCRHNKGIQFNLDRESVSQNWLADNQFTIIDFICDLEYYSYSHNLSPVSFLKMHFYPNNYLGYSPRLSVLLLATINQTCLFVLNNKKVKSKVIHLKGFDKGFILVKQDEGTS